MKSRPAAGYQVTHAAERLGDTRPNPHGGEDDLSSSQAAVILQNTSADIVADLRDRFTLLLPSPPPRYRARGIFSLTLLPGTGPIAPFYSFLPAERTPTSSSKCRLQTRPLLLIQRNQPPPSSSGTSSIFLQTPENLFKTCTRLQTFT